MSRIKVTVLAGGIGGARFIKGLRLIDGLDISVIVNNGDDVNIHGLRVCPDLDSIIYNLSGESDLQRGWGRKDETWVVQENLTKYLGATEWFNIGDKDYATHIFRTEKLNEGIPLDEIVKAQCVVWGLKEKILPVTNEFVETYVHLESGTPIHFQEWWVKHRASLPANGFELRGSDVAKPAPGVLEAINSADVIIFPPSNPVVSIGMILRIPGVADAVKSANAPVVGVSPIIGNNPVLGMADKCLTALGLETSAFSVAKLHSEYLDAWLIADDDEKQVGEVERLGIKCKSTPLLMSDDQASQDIAQAAINMVL